MELYLGNWFSHPHRLTSTVIGQIAAMTSLRSLELENWQEWDDVTPIAALPLLTRLTCDQGLRLVADMLRPGCLQSLEVAFCAHKCVLQLYFPASNNFWSLLKLGIVS